LYRVIALQCIAHMLAIAKLTFSWLGCLQTGWDYGREGGEEGE